MLTIIAGTELYHRWERGEYRPYTDDELVDLVAECKTRVPPYCRVNRVFRDIPADDIVAGVRLESAAIGARAYGRAARSANASAAGR